MQFIVSDQTNPYWNIAVENYLVDCLNVSFLDGSNTQAIMQSSNQTIVFYLWRNCRTVVIGQNQNPYSEVNLEALEADGGYLMRRKTGGGAVYHDDGNLNFSFIVPKSLYDQRRQFSVIQRAVESFGLHTELSGRNDILVDLTPDPSPKGEGSGISQQQEYLPPSPLGEGLGVRPGPEVRLRKFSGNAFSKGRVNDLHHGTLLISGDMSNLARYLKPKPAKLLKHGVQSVRSRVVNLAELNPAITTESIVPRLRQAFEAEYHDTAEEISFAALMENPAVRVLHDHFASDEWKYGRWRTFVAQCSAQFDWGGVEVALTVDEARGVITDVQLASDSLDLAALDEARRLLTGAVMYHRPHTENPLVSDILSLVY